jgi:hypothetical protein
LDPQQTTEVSFMTEHQVKSATEMRRIEIA